jgi:hypothetical protein
VRLPRCWVVERSFGWAAQFRRLARTYGRLTDTPDRRTTSPSGSWCFMKRLPWSGGIHNGSKFAMHCLAVSRSLSLWREGAAFAERTGLRETWNRLR